MGRTISGKPNDLRWRSTCEFGAFTARDWTTQWATFDRTILSTIGWLLLVMKLANCVRSEAKTKSLTVARPGHRVTRIPPKPETTISSFLFCSRLCLEYHQSQWSAFSQIRDPIFNCLLNSPSSHQDILVRIEPFVSYVALCSPARAFILGTIALYFHFCTFSSALAFIPLVRRQSNIESQWAQTLPAVIDGPKEESGRGNDEVVAGTNMMCCTTKEIFLEKPSTTCERGVSSLYFDLFSIFSHFPLVEPLDPSTLLPIYIPTHFFLVWCIIRGSERQDQNPLIIQKSNHGTILFLQSHQRPVATAPYTNAPYPPISWRLWVNVSHHCYINPHPRVSNHLITLPPQIYVS